MNGLLNLSSLAKQRSRRLIMRNCQLLLGTFPRSIHKCKGTDRRRPTGSKVKLSNGRTVTNLASYNFYNFVGNEQVKEKAIQTLRTYGVGPCGPPQFYGTQDVHMKTEADIASCLGTEGCIVYAQAFSTISSVIPAFCKRGDIIVADRAVNYAIRKGLQISRSTIRYYEHNDMEDLERVLQKVVKEQSKKPLTRRFIVTEGLFETVGDCVDLPKLVLTPFAIVRWRITKTSPG
jgi:7-keto-8-aminopelargonate synthetase-like enzyme